MDTKRYNTKFILFEIIVIMLGIIGVTFAASYIMKNINVNVDTASLAVDYTGSLTLPKVDLLPIDDSSVDTNTDNVMRINFTVKGASSNPNIPIIYDVILSDLEIDSELKNEYLKWELEKNGSVISNGSFSPEFDTIRDGKLWLTEIQQDLPTNSGTADSYEFRLWISESCTGDITACTEDMDQSNMLGKKISGKIETVLYTKGKEALVRKPGYIASKYIISLLDSNPDSMNNDDPDGNVRYMGKDPNNYVDIGDKYPYGFTVNKWEKLNISFQTADECRQFFNCSVNYEGLGFSSEEECNTNINQIVEERYGVSSLEEFNNTYCVVEDKSNEPILWRVIGVFDVSSTYNGTIEKRLKIIRDDRLGLMVWDSSNRNDWSNASLQTYLNGEYYNGLDSTSKSLIGDTYWNLGGTSSYTSSSNGLASHFYGYERGTTVYSGHPTYWIGKIGLMYPSDFGYATSGGTITNRTSCLSKEMYNWSSSSYSDCKNNDYLYNYTHSDWTMTSLTSGPSSVFEVGYDPVLCTSSADSGRYVRPTAYLKPSVIITSGDGSQENPYVLSN